MLNALFILADTAGAAANLLALVKGVIGPIFLAIVIISAVIFLWKKQTTQFFVFLALAVLVAAVIYVPDIITSFGEGVGGELKDVWK